jgi:hypothetical protein
MSVVKFVSRNFFYSICAVMRRHFWWFPRVNPVLDGVSLSSCTVLGWQAQLIMYQLLFLVYI